MRSRLLFEAEKHVSNPFLLCALISGRTRQLMMSQNGHASTADLVDYALNEMTVGALEFEAPGAQCSSSVSAGTPQQQTRAVVVERSESAVSSLHVEAT